MARRKSISYRTVAKRIKGTVCAGSIPRSRRPEDERRLVRGLLVYLEDRRALYYPQDMESRPWVRDSVQQIRGELTQLLREAPEGASLVEPVRAMRAACRKYLDALGHPGQRHRMSYHPEAVWWQALGELRAVFGRELAILSVIYSVNLPIEFDGIIPAADEEVA